MKSICYFINKYNVFRLWLSFFCFIVLLIVIPAVNACAKERDLSFLTQEEQEWLAKLNKPIRLAPDQGFEPVEIKGPNGELLGIAGEYIDIIERVLGITFEVVWYDSWAECVHEAQKGNVDLWSAVVPTPQRSEYMSFTSPYAEIQPVFVVPDSEAGEIFFETLGERRLAVVEEWYHQDLIERSYPQIHLSTVASIKDGLIALQNGEADVFVTDIIAASYLIRTLNLKGLRIAGDVPLKSKGLCMAIRRDWPVFKAILEKALARITPLRKDEIYRRWVLLESGKSGSQHKWYQEYSTLAGAGVVLFVVTVFLCVLLSGRSSKGELLSRKRIVIFISILCLIVISGGLWKYAGLWLGASSKNVDLTSEEKRWLASQKIPLTIAPDCGFAPIEWIDDNGVFRGIAAEYLRLVESKLGIRFRIIQIHDWDDNVSAAKRRDFDVWTAVAPTPERRQYMNFTTPHIKLTAALIVNSGTPGDFTLETITTQRVAVVRNYFTHEYIKQYFPEIALVPVPDARAGMRALAFMQVDAVFSDIATASYIIRQEGISSLEVRQAVNVGYDLAFASRKDWPILGRILNKAVTSISPEEHSRIMEKWTGGPTKKGIDFSLVIRVGMVVVAVLAALLFWSFSLKRLVKIRTRELREAQQSLIRANNYISDIINSMPSVLIGVDCEGNITQWNLEAERTTGLSPGEAVGQPLFKAIPRLSAEMDRVRLAIAERREQSDSKRAHREDGETIYENVTIYPLNAAGVEGAVIRIDDVTDKVRMEEMMVQSEKMLSVGGLAAGMAHEINNPLAGMMQTASVMANRLGEKPDMPANLKAAEAAGITMAAIKSFMEARDILCMIKTINESGQRVAGIVNNMLSFARKSDTAVSSHDMAGLFDKALELAATDYDLTKQYDFKAIEIVKEYEDNLPFVPCEGAKIQQVLLNILRNGTQAMQEAGTEKPRFIVRTSFEKARKMVCMEIDDNGPGMDKETRKRVFEPFFTTKPVGVGTGLGLSVSYFIITENHGGEMTVESAPGSGAKFIIRLPVGGNRSEICPGKGTRKI